MTNRYGFTNAQLAYAQTSQATWNMEEPRPVVRLPITVGFLSPDEEMQAVGWYELDRDGNRRPVGWFQPKIFRDAPVLTPEVEAIEAQHNEALPLPTEDDSVDGK